MSDFGIMYLESRIIKNKETVLPLFIYWPSNTYVNNVD